MSEPIAIELIKRSKDIQSREVLDDDVVEEYAEILRGDKTNWPFPPVTLFDDGDGFWLASGFHRVAGAELAKRSSVTAEIIKGDKRAAQLFAASTNADHGKRRTNADKRFIVKRFLEDDEWSQKSARWIAETCKVSNRFVSTIKAEENGSSTVNVHSATVQTKDGRVHPAKRNSAPASQAEAEGPESTDDETDALASPTAPSADPVIDRARRNLKERLRGVRLDLGNLGHGGKFEPELRRIEQGVGL